MVIHCFESLLKNVKRVKLGNRNKSKDKELATTNSKDEQLFQSFRKEVWKG